jgi:glycine C-acetyltransferase
MNDKELKRRLEDIEQKGRLRRMRIVDGRQGTEVKLDGDERIMLCSNDYLGLAGDERICSAAKNALDRFGFGAGASRLISGNMTSHLELESKLASFKGTEAALLFNSGYTANISVLPALAGVGDLIISDELNHASIIDGCRLSRADVKIYPHNDCEALRRILDDHRGKRMLIVTESLFSMDGDFAPLSELVALAEEFDATLMVDEAHATGCYGKTGSGLVEQYELTDRGIIQMGTLGKALGGYGAYIAGSRALIDYLINTARGFIFSTALPPSIAAAAAAAIDICRESTEERKKLQETAIMLRNYLIGLGLDVPRGESQIIPIVMGAEDQAMRAAQYLLDCGIYVQGIRPPTVPEGTSRLRLTVTATLEDGQTKKIKGAFAGLFDGIRK